MKFETWIKTGALIVALLYLSGCVKQSTSTITFGGDIMLARGGKPISSELEQVDLSLPKDMAVETSETNLYVANLESPLTEESTILQNLANPDMNLCAGVELLNMLKDSGFDLMTINNNHKDDCTPDGIEQTSHILNESGFGSFYNENGTWVSILPDRHLVFIAVDDVNHPVSEEQISSTIHAQKADGNFVVVSAHWGNEYQAGPDSRQETLAQGWVDAGADVIWGHHPHVLQRMEWLTSKTDGHSALVLYSLGNLLSDQFMLPDTQRSAFYRVTVKNNSIQKVMVIPFMMDWTSNSLNYRLPENEREKILERLKVTPFGPIDVGVYP